MNWTELVLYLMIYSFLGWCAEVLYYAVTRRKFCNRGILTLPFLLSYGTAFDLMILLLPALAGQPAVQYLFTLVAVSVTDSFADHLNRRLGPAVNWGKERPRILGGSLRGLLFSAAVAAAFYFVYLVIHPLLLALMLLIPELAKQVAALVFLVLAAADLVGVLATLRRGGEKIEFRTLCTTISIAYC